MATLKLSRPSQPFFTLAVPSSRMFGKKCLGRHQDAINLIKKKTLPTLNCNDLNFQLFPDHVKIIVDGAFFSLNMQVVFK